jgi:hypothetical protein
MGDTLWDFAYRTEGKIFLEQLKGDGIIIQTLFTSELIRHECWFHAAAALPPGLESLVRV